MASGVERVFRVCGCLGALLLMTAQNSLAQVEQQPSAITGTVFLEDGNRPAGGVVVREKSLEGGSTIGVLSDENGAFQTPRLGPGAYEVFAEKPGYESTRVTAKPQEKPGTVKLYLRAHAEQLNRADTAVSVRELSIPRKARTAFEKGARCVSNRDFAASLSYFKKAVEEFPGFYEAYYDLGAAELELRQDEQAMEALQKAIDLSEGRYTLAEFTMGLLLWQTHKLPEAEAVLRRALEQDASYVKGYLYLGAVLFDLGKLDEAEKFIREAQLRRPDLAASYLILAKIYSHRGNSSEVMQNLETYLRLQPPGTDREAVAQAYERIQMKLRQQQNAQRSEVKSDSSLGLE